MTYKNLLSPGKIGNLELRNRTIFPPMGTAMAKDGEVTERHIRYHARRAQGGCGMNIVEISGVHYSAAYPSKIGLYDDKFLPGLTRLASAIKEAGGKACIQLWHGGRQNASDYGAPWAPSAIPCPLVKEMPHEITIAEIQEVVAAFGEAADRAKRAGFDAVEIHAAHGYLLDGFLSPHSNKRTDEYGGSFENRIRITLEAIAAVRKSVGKDFPILIRVSISANVEGGLTAEEGFKAVKLYEEAGVDAIDVSQGNYVSLPYTIPPYFLPQGVNVANAAEVKKFVKIPVVVAGRMITPEFAEQVLESGAADFISLGREQLADPDFVKKAAAGQASDIVRCIACDQGCIGRVWTQGGVSCVFNPLTGHESEIVIKPADTKKKILVIGGGPAGLEAARVAAERGHSVVLFEKTGRLGGQFLIAGTAPHKEIFTDSAIHLGYRAQKAGVDVRLYTEASPDNITAVKPDEIIIAAGSDPLTLNIPGIDGSNVYEARAFMGSSNYIAEADIVVIGGGLVGLEAAEILTCQGKKVAVVEMLDKVGKDMDTLVMPYFDDFIKKHGLTIHTDSKCVKIGPDFVEIEKNGENVRLSCQAVVIATGARSNKRVEELVKPMNIPYHVIGDANRPSKVLNAIWSGNEIARSL